MFLSEREKSATKEAMSILEKVFPHFTLINFISHCLTFLAAGRCTFPCNDCGDIYLCLYDDTSIARLVEIGYIQYGNPMLELLTEYQHIGLFGLSPW